MVNETKLILNKLDDIKSELDSIKEPAIDIDLILTQDDINVLHTAENDLQQDKTRML